MSKRIMARDPESGFRVRSRFTFMELTEVAQPASPLRWLGDSLLGFVGARGVIEKDARQFLRKLLEVNSTRVQSDTLSRVQESREYLGVEIRKPLHEVGRVADQALKNARRVREEGAAAVEAALDRLSALEGELKDHS